LTTILQFSLQAPNGQTFTTACRNQLFEEAQIIAQGTVLAFQLLVFNAQALLRRLSQSKGLRPARPSFIGQLLTDSAETSEAGNLPLHVRRQ
jgi:hypothetical protein